MLKTPAIALAALVAATATADAGEVSGGGTVSYDTKWQETTDLRNGQKLYRNRIRGVILADDPAAPMHLGLQTCSGSTVLGTDGAPVTGSGSCEAQDKDGDVWWLHWTNSTASRTWTIIGGTGKFEGMAGNGTTELITQAQDGRSVIRWQGKWSMKAQ